MDKSSEQNTHPRTVPAWTIRQMVVDTKVSKTCTIINKDSILILNVVNPHVVLDREQHKLRTIQAEINLVEDGYK